MKIYRPLAVLLFAFICGLAASAQESSELASLRAKAVKGNGIAQYNLGLAYAQGRGVAADPIEGFVWLSLARENGARGRALDNLVSSLDKAAYENAQKRLTERKAELGHKPSTAASTPATAPTETPAVQEMNPAPAAAPAQAATATEELARLRAERETFSAQITDLTGNVTALRAERVRLIKLAAEHEKAARESAEAGRVTQEQARASEVRATELVRTNEAAKAELERTKQSLAALARAPKPAADTSALDQKTRELQATLAELEASRNFGTQVENTLNKVTDQKTTLETQLAAATSAKADAQTQTAALALAKEEVQQKLNTITAEHTALQSEIAQLRQRSTTPAYPDHSGRVRELESSLADIQRQLAAKPAAPGYPDLSGRVSELEGQLAKARLPAAPKYPDLSGRVRDLESSLADTQRQLAAMPSAPAFPDLRTNVAALEAQLATAQQALAAKSKPADTSALDQKNRELQATLAELEAARNFGSQLESTLNKATDLKTALEGQLANANNEANRNRQEMAVLAKAREEAQQKLNAVAVEHTALQSEVAQLRQRPAAPAYPDLSGRVRELEAQVSSDLSTVASAKAEATQARQEVIALTKAKAEASKSAVPASPDLSGKVNELETALAETSRQLIAAQNAAATKPTPPSYPDLSGRVGELEAAVATAIQKFGATEQARAELSKQFDDYKSATITAQRERTTIQAQVKMLESDKTALRRQVDAATAETGQLRTQVAGLKMQQVAVKPAAPAYPDFSGKVNELEAQVNSLQAAVAAKPAAPSYPDLSGRVRELESNLADTQRLFSAKSAAPSYPDLSGRVNELEGQLAKARQPAAPKYPDLSGRVRELEAQVSAGPPARWPWRRRRRTRRPRLATSPPSATAPGAHRTNCATPSPDWRRKKPSWPRPAKPPRLIRTCATGSPASSPTWRPCKRPSPPSPPPRPTPILPAGSEN